MSSSDFKSKYGLLVLGLSIPLLLMLGIIGFSKLGAGDSELSNSGAMAAASGEGLELGDWAAFPRQFQGQLEGKLRRLKLHSLNPQGQKAAFLYVLLLGSRGDQDQAGSIDLQNLRFSLSSIGEGSLKKEGKNWVLVFDDNKGSLKSID